MTFIGACFLSVVFVLGVVGYLYMSSKVNNAEFNIDLLKAQVQYLEKSEKTLRESVDIQTKCIRDLNDVVKKSVGNKEPIEPDTKALLAGWVVEEPEPPKEEQLNQIDAFRIQKFISSLNCKSATPLYPWQQSELNGVLGPYGIREERINK